MNDRVANHPGRWKLTPVTGTTDTYDFERADDPTVEGTKLNKATFLPDAVASAIAAATGGSNINLPADALNAIASALSTIGLSNNAKIEALSYTGSGNNSKQINFSIKPRIVFVFDTNGVISDYRQMWIYNITKGSSCSFGYSESNKRLTITASGYPAQPGPAMNASATTYYVVAVGVK